MEKHTPKKKFDKSIEEALMINFDDYEKHLEQMGEQNKFLDALEALEETYHPNEVVCRDE